MITAYLLREYYEDHTRGVLIAKDDDGNIVLSCVVLELPWKDNERIVSCIPEGMYLVRRRWTAKFKGHYHLQNVPDRTYILQHPGNYTSDIKGCQLPGLEIKHLNSDAIPDVTNTRVTLDGMLKKFGQEYILHIGSFYPPKFPHKLSPDYASTIPPGIPQP